MLTRVSRIGRWNIQVSRGKLSLRGETLVLEETSGVMDIASMRKMMVDDWQL